MSQKNKLTEYKETIKEILDKGYYAQSVQDKLIENPSLKELTVCANNLCNLRCKHCSYGIPSGTEFLHDKELSEKETINFIKNISKKHKLNIIAFAGREPFFNNKTTNIMNELDQLISEDYSFRYGAVSNGTLIKPRIDSLKKNKNLDWIDISLDGDEKIHDSIRGKGVYRKAVASLRELLEKKISRYIGISTCCHKDNYKVLPELFEKLYHEIGLRNICILPYVFTGMNEKGFTSSKENFLNFFKKMTTNNELGKLPLNILFDFEWFTIPFLKELFEKDLISLDNLELDEEETPYILIENNKSTILIKINILEFNRFLLTSDGYLGTMWIMESLDYWKLAVGNIRDKKIDKEFLRETLKRQFAHMNKNLKQNKEILISEV
ncbi:radical SAM protein [Candidatus Pacearchaeota archaeon]|nr:radical SAM protein [Candidatus Pacearchaeota archaeon]